MTLSMTLSEVVCILLLSYVVVQAWMLSALLVEALAVRSGLRISAQEAYTFGFLGLIVCLMLYAEKRYGKWKAEQKRKWDS